MGFLIGLLTFILVVDCIVLVFLVLIQLPKKEAGAGLAFGGAATDALFGAGSGTVLTKVTKYAAGIFFVLAVVLAILQKNFQNPHRSNLERRLSQPAATSPSSLPPGSGPASTPATTPEAAPPASTPTPSIPLTSTNISTPAEAPAPPPANTAPAPAPK